jgi:hypothetical protein
VMEVFIPTLGTLRTLQSFQDKEGLGATEGRDGKASGRRIKSAEPALCPGPCRECRR